MSTNSTSRPRVGLDISAIPYNRGVSRYTANLARALSTKKEQIDLSLFGTSMRQKKILVDFCATACPGIPSRIMPHPVSVMNALWNDFHVVSPERWLGDIDVFHSWEMQPRLHKAKLVSTIHDLAMLRFPKTAHPKILAMNQASWKHLKKEAAMVIAVSEATKKDILEFLNIEEDRIKVIYEALPEESRKTIQPERREMVLQNLKLDSQKPFVLFVGTQEPRKNLKHLIAGWEKLQSEFDLVLAGAPGWETVPNLPGLKKLGVVDDEQLATLYEEAAVFAFPSLYEGFGLPILEAFHHGAPVVTSNVSSMPEIAGKAAVLINPEDPDSITAGIEKAHKEKVTLVKAGKKQLEKFSWDKAAEETIGVYKKVAA